MAGLSVAKVNRNETKHCKKIRKQVEHFKQQLNDEFFGENAILVGDSKLRHLSIEMSSKTHINIIWRSGAPLEHNYLTQQVNRHIGRYANPVVLLWFGTCEFTGFIDGNKKNNYINLVPNFNNVTTTLINKYTAYKQRCLAIKPNARIIFIETPIYSLIQWNKKLGHPHPEIYTNNQIRLENAIVDFNKLIRELNDPFLPPHINQDMYLYIKRKASQPQTKKPCYMLLIDGIHPGKPISQLWLIRIKLFLRRL